MNCYAPLLKAVITISKQRSELFRSLFSQSGAKEVIQFEQVVFIDHLHNLSCIVPVTNDQYLKPKISLILAITCTCAIYKIKLSLSTCKKNRPRLNLCSGYHFPNLSHFQMPLCLLSIIGYKI